MLLAACGAWLAARSRDHEAEPPLLLFTTLPLYWAEADDLAASLDAAKERHWVRRAIEERRELRPVDALTASTLAGARDLLMAQPRPLMPAENVALDDWVAAGGRLLLFADPALTAASRFAIGDRRRPADIVLLSPILARWGLKLEFDEAQRAGEHPMQIGDVDVPVDLGGRFVAMPGGRGAAGCQFKTGGLVVHCRVGRGRVTAIADAAVLDDPGDSARKAALAALMNAAF